MFREGVDNGGVVIRGLIILRVVKYYQRVYILEGFISYRSPY